MTLASLLDEREDDDAALAVAVYSGDCELTRTGPRASATGLAEALTAASLVTGQPVGVMLPNGSEVVADGSCGSYGWSASMAPALDVPAHEPDIALVQFTSGTTGRPKSGPSRCWFGIQASCGLPEPVLKKLVGSTDKLAARKTPMPNLIPISMALSAGIHNVLFAFRVGAPVVILDGFRTTEFAEVVARHGIRSTVLPPAAMTMLVDDPEIVSLARLKYVRSISARLSPLQARRFRDRFGVLVMNCYGQTEIGGEIVGWNAADVRAYGDSRLGSVGRPHEGVSLRIVYGDGADRGTGEPGELW